VFTTLFIIAVVLFLASVGVFVYTKEIEADTNKRNMITILNNKGIKIEYATVKPIISIQVNKTKFLQMINILETDTVYYYSNRFYVLERERNGVAYVYNTLEW